MSTIKISQLPQISQIANLSSNTSNTYFVAAEVVANVTGKISASELASSLYVNNPLPLGGNIIFSDGTIQNTAAASNSYSNAAFSTANLALSSANSASRYANSAISLAQASYNFANTISGGSAVDNVARVYANSAYDQANTATNNAASASLYANSGISLGQVVFNSANSASNYANSGITLAQASYDSGNAIQSNLTNTNVILQSAYNTANSAGIYANSGITLAQASFNQLNVTSNFANTLYSANGGVVTGDMNITGNVTVNGTYFYANTSGFYVGTNQIVLNNSASGVTPAQNVGILVHRGPFIETGLFWNESNQSWVFTTNGINYDVIANTSSVSSALTVAQAAYDAANTIASTTVVDITARSVANASYNQANTATNNAASASLYANSGITLAQAVYNQSNSVAPIANSGITLAQAAFNAQNSTAAVANTKFSSSGGTVSGSVSITSDLTVSGNLLINGNTTTISSSQLVVNDPLIYLGIGNYVSDTLDIGFIGHYNSSGNAHSGLIRDPNLKEYIFFQGYIPEVESNNIINIADPSFAYANVYASYFKGNVIANGVNLGTYVQSVYNQSNSVAIVANTANNTAVSAGIYANSGITLAQAVYDQSNGVTIIANTAVANANSASNYANTGISLAQAAFNRANVIQGGSF
jgi:hypothetical protein